MKSYSQSGQDLWALSHFPEGHLGTYLELGAAHPDQGNNTLLLEQLGWKGLSLDWYAHFADMWREFGRTNPIVTADATKYEYMSGHVDYLSLDCDDNDANVLRRLFEQGVTFHCATIEHDMYARGPDLRDEIRGLMAAQGYLLSRPDVSWENMNYEDWYTRG